MGSHTNEPGIEEHNTQIEKLFAAILVHDKDKVKEILGQPPSIPNTTEFENFANAEVAKYHERSPKALLEEGKVASILTQDILRSQAIKNGDAEIDTHDDWHTFQLPFHIACLLGNKDIVDALLKPDIKNINSRNGSGETPLSVACRAGKLNIVEQLLEAKALANEEDGFGYTPLDYLRRRGDPKWVNPPSDVDYKRVFMKLLEKVIKDLEVEEPLHVASAEGEIFVVECLLEIKPDCINNQDESGWTALHFAAWGGELAVVKLLLNKGANYQLYTKDSYNTDAEGLALHEGYYEIAREIWNHQRQKELVDERKKQSVDFISTSARCTWLKDDTTRKSPFRKPAGKPELQSTFNIVFNETFRQQLLKPDKKLWVHLPANNDLCLNIYGDKSNIFSLINFLSSLLGPQGQSPSFRGHHYQQEILPPRNDDSGEPEGPPDTGQSEGAQDSASPKSSTRKNLGSVTIMIVPMIDVDLLKPGGFIRPCVLRQLAGPECSAQEQEEQAKESTTPRDRSEQSQLDMSAANDSSQRTNAPGKMEQHIHAMKTLHSAAKDTLHEPRTLDHYSNADLNEAQLGALDEEQVLIRYFAQLAGGKIGRRSKQSKNKFIQARRMIFEYFTAGLRRHSSSYTYSDPEKAQQPKAQQPADQQGTDQDGGGNTTNTPLRLIPENADHRHILVVPHLWLIMVDDVLITSFPDRWDHQNTEQFQKDLNGIMDDVGPSTDIKFLFHRIAKQSFEFVPSVPVKDKALKFTEVFMKEIQRISMKVNEQYVIFRSKVGNSDNEFLRISKTVLQCYVDIKDVTEEIAILKQVYEDRARAWILLHLNGNTKTEAKQKWFSNKALPIEHKMRGLDLTCDCEWVSKKKRKRCDASETVLDSLSSMKKIETDAQNVFKETKSLMGLLHGQASTENAVKASEQSQYLAWFTIVTVIFTPLSFVTALLALPIESFTPTTWTQTQVTQACAGSLVATIVLCVMPTAYIWLFRKFEAHEDSKSDAYKASNTNHEKKSGGASRILHNLFMVAFPLLFLIVLSGVLAWLAIR